MIGDNRRVRHQPVAVGPRSAVGAASLDVEQSATVVSPPSTLGVAEQDRPMTYP